MSISYILHIYGYSFSQFIDSYKVHPVGLYYIDVTNLGNISFFVAIGYHPEGHNNLIFLKNANVHALNVLSLYDGLSKIIMSSFWIPCHYHHIKTFKPIQVINPSSLQSTNFFMLKLEGIIHPCEYNLLKRRKTHKSWSRADQSSTNTNTIIIQSQLHSHKSVSFWENFGVVLFSITFTSK